MRLGIAYKWDIGIAEARKIQEQLREKWVGEDQFEEIRTVAGLDAAFVLTGSQAFAASQNRWTALREANREIPALLAALGKLRQMPDLILCDGQGYAHPRRMGLATHLGIVLDRPTIGCAKSILIGKHEPVGNEKGEWAPMMDGEERIGAALRTRAGVKPMYISPGHRISLETALRLTLSVCDGPRIPRPTRDADHYVSELKAARVGSKGNKGDK